MENRIRLCLTGVLEKLTDEAEKKLDTYEETILEPTCENGRTVEDYKNLGFPDDKIPKDLLKKQKDFELGIKLKDEDYEEVLSDVVLYEDEIVLMAEDVETNSTVIHLKNLLTVRVLEKPFEIDAVIDYMKMNWFNKKYLLLINFLRKNNEKDRDF
jgi:hypothetical protein